MFKETKVIENESIKNVVKFDQDCRNISGTIKHCIDIQVKRLKKNKNKNLKKQQNIFKQQRKQGQVKQKKVKILYWHTNFVQLAKTWHTQKSCWCRYVHYVRNLLHPCLLQDAG